MIPILILMKLKGKWKIIMTNDGKSIDIDKLDDMYKEIYKIELKNDKTGKWDDREMVNGIFKFLMKRAKEEMEEQS